jgi:hypothetical protein
MQVPGHVKGKVQENSQLSQRRLDIWKFEKYRFISNSLIVEHKANAPDRRRKTFVFGASQVIQDDFSLSVRRHFQGKFNNFFDKQGTISYKKAQVSGCHSGWDTRKHL